MPVFLQQKSCYFLIIFNLFFHICEFIMQTLDFIPCKKYNIDKESVIYGKRYASYL